LTDFGINRYNCMGLIGNLGILKKRVVKNPYEVIGTTADIGLMVYGEDLEALFQNAGCGLCSLMTKRDRLREKISRQVRLKASDLEGLMFSWLNKLIYLYETEGLLGKKYQVRIFDPPQLQATIRGEKVDRKRHTISRLIKAATYHQLEIKEVNGQWQAHLIFDV